MDTKELDSKFQKPTSPTTNTALDNNLNVLDFDELEAYFGEDYYVTDKIKISQPTIIDLVKFGDTRFYQEVISRICGNPTTFRLQLWKADIDWNDLSDFMCFSLMIKHLTPDKTRLLFGDLNLSWFEMFHDYEKDCDILVYVPRDEHGNYIQVDYDDAIIIDEFVYAKIVGYIRHMFNYYPKIEKAKNKATKEAIIWEDEMKLENQMINNESTNKSVLLPLISAVLNHPGFKYKKNELKEVGIIEFMDSVNRLKVYESSIALLHGAYSGMIDTSKIDNKNFDFTRELNN